MTGTTNPFFPAAPSLSPRDHVTAQRHIRRRLAGDAEEDDFYDRYAGDTHKFALHPKSPGWQRRKILVWLLAVVAVGLLLLFSRTPGSTAEGLAWSCPEIYGEGPERRLLPTLSHLWPDRQVDKVLPHPAVYMERAEAREHLGPLFWARADDDAVYRCFLVIVDAALAASLFARDGFVYNRGGNGNGDGAMKFAIGHEWKRQRSLIEKEVLTDASKRERAQAALPNATACFLTQLRASSGSPINMIPLARECLALFMVSAVLGVNWPGLTMMASQMAECERSMCAGFFESMLRSALGDTFECLGEMVRTEVTRRSREYYTPGKSTAVDPDKDSLTSRMIQLTLDAGRHESQGYLKFEEVVGNTISFVSAGWETSSLTFVNTLWLLTAWTAFPKSKSLQNHLREEATRGRTEIALKTIAETLLWRPPIPWHGGNSMEELEAVFNGTRYKIPADTRIIVDILGINNPPSHHLVGGWDPESKRRGVEHHAGGTGSRHCPGGKLAIRGMSVIIGYILKEFQLRAVDGSAVEDWLQSYTGEMHHDLCKMLFQQVLEVIPEPAT